MTRKLPEYIDVIVVGSGFAGLAAAIEAAEAGASVLVVEKMMAPGGNSLISDGGIAAPNTELQQKSGIKDSPELMAGDMIAAGEGLNYPSLVKKVAREANSAFCWSRDYVGVKYRERVDLFSGHSVARCYSPLELSGRALIEGMLACLKRLEVPVFLGLSATTLHQGNSGKVTGLSLQETAQVKKLSRASTREIGVNKGVIVASGGFGSDVSFRQAQDPRLGAAVMSTNRRSATAEFLKECLRIGANPVQLSRIQLGPWASPDEKGYGLGPHFGDYLALPYGIIIDPATGSRFTNELGNRKELSDAILDRGHPVIGITDRSSIDKAGWDISRGLSKGVVKEFDSTPAMAGYFGIDAASMGNTMAKFSTMVKAGKDSDFEKPILVNASTFEKPPFFAMRMWPKVHHTMGGLQIDGLARAINLNQEVINGLYAAGEVTGGIHGACRLGSCAITECLVFGRIAGLSAASA